MAKKPERAPTGPSAGLAHNPFAALAGLSAPPAPAVPSAPPPAAPPASPASASPRWIEGKVVVRRERKGRGGKTVTCITGIAPASRAELLLRMKKALGCGGTVEEDALVLLGDLQERAAGWLEAEGAKRVVRGT